MWKTMLYLLIINVSVHYGKQVRRLVQQDNLSIYFQPTYCPELAPVKAAFSLIKQRIIQQIRKRSSDFKKMKKASYFRSTLRTTSNDNLKNMAGNYQSCKRMNYWMSNATQSINFRINYVHEGDILIQNNRGDRWRNLTFENICRHLIRNVNYF